MTTHENAAPSGDSSVDDYGMSYCLGTTCWHVVGYVNGDTLRSVLLCGAKPNEYSIGGGPRDVLASDMRVCLTCDRATGGGATGDIDRLRIDLCLNCDGNGLVWDPTVDGNVVSCDHGRAPYNGSSPAREP